MDTRFFQHRHDSHRHPAFVLILLVSIVLLFLIPEVTFGGYNDHWYDDDDRYEDDAYRNSRRSSRYDRSDDRDFRMTVGDIYTRVGDRFRVHFIGNDTQISRGRMLFDDSFVWQRRLWRYGNRREYEFQALRSGTITLTFRTRGENGRDEDYYYRIHIR